MLSFLCRVCCSEVSAFSVLQDGCNLKLNSFLCAKHKQQGPTEGRTENVFVAWPVSEVEGILQGTSQKFCQPRKILIEGKKSSRLCWKRNNFSLQTALSQLTPLAFRIVTWQAAQDTRAHQERFQPQPWGHPFPDMCRGRISADVTPCISPDKKQLAEIFKKI